MASVFQEMVTRRSPCNLAGLICSRRSPKWLAISRVTAGENRGRLLNHDYVVLEWQGPHALGERELKLKLLPRAAPADSGVVAFVQDRSSAEVLQALQLGEFIPLSAGEIDRPQVPPGAAPMPDRAWEYWSRRAGY